MRLYNTLTRTKEVFTPFIPGEISMYVCGPTVYDRAHLGNARPYVVVDVLVRLLQRSHKLTYARNITDIDDKIIMGAQKAGTSIDELTKKTTKAFHNDMDQLNILRPTIEPRATDHVQEMISIIERLIALGHAYEASQHVLFDVTSDLTYGELSRRSLDDMIAGARVEVAPYKRNPMDFVLWKPSNSEEPGWQSPWGRGRPGWHIECSAMSHKHLGETFDIHGGGQDLIFPHHENERAQSLCAFKNSKFARYWMHNGILTINGEKMSKSLGNFFTVSDLLKKEHGETIRFVLLQTHYRQPLDWNERIVEQARMSLNKFYGALRDFKAEHQIDELDQDFLNALEDDLNTPLAIARMHEITGFIHKASSLEEKNQMQNRLWQMTQLMGICKESVDTWFQYRHSSESLIDPVTIEKKIEERKEARAQKDFATSDRIRKELMDLGILLEDAGTETIWKRIEK